MLEAESESEFHTLEVPVTNRRFRVWRGRDAWHKDISVQIRLERDGDLIYVSSGRYGKYTSAVVTLEELQQHLAKLIEQKREQTMKEADKFPRSKNE